MYIELQGQENEEKVLRLKVYITDGELRIETVDREWNILALRIVDEKLSLVRYTDVGDKRIATNDSGQIEEVTE